MAAEPGMAGGGGVRGLSEKTLARLRRHGLVHDRWWRKHRDLREARDRLLWPGKNRLLRGENGFSTDVGRKQKRGPRLWPRRSDPGCRSSSRRRAPGRCGGARAEPPRRRGRPKNIQRREAPG